MNLIKYNSLQILIYYLFLHRVAILRQFFRLKEHKPNTLIWVCIALIGMFKTLKF